MGSDLLSVSCTGLSAVRVDRLQGHLMGPCRRCLVGSDDRGGCSSCDDEDCSFVYV
jgi:hypothetical protein